jgi:carbonic anhydrase
MPDVLEQLKEGIRSFQKTTYPPNAAAYQKAATTPQTPHTLMITCSDSRIDIESVCNAKPGELFITRNVGNLVPGYGASSGDSVSAVVEYAVNALKVKHIVICGHSDCGAMKALLKPEALNTLPAVKKWVDYAHRPASGETPLPEQTEANVRQQLEQLKTHPAVNSALARGELTLSGWVYDIGSGDVRIAPDGQQSFEVVKRGVPA